MEQVSTKNAPAAIGPYSQGCVSGGFIFTSGQIPLDPVSGEVLATGIREQAERAILNLKAVLEAGGSSADRVVKTTCFLADMADFAAFNEVYEKHFPGKPSRSCVSVKGLPRGVLCEIEAIAERG